MKRWSVLLLLAAVIPLDTAIGKTKWQVEQVIDVAPVPAGFPVGFCLLTEGERQYAAYYDEDRRMTVASRLLESDQWQVQVLPSRVGWDSHNYITMALDQEGQLHVSGNMHADPLVYFRTDKAGDITTLRKEPMTGKLESRATYPEFLKDHNGDLIFTYRHGGSGNGINLYNKYDVAKRSWSRLMESPLFDGEGRINAYPLGPVRGPDGWFHTVWVWRDTPDCATNHDLSYARSRDLVHWESAFGDEVELPIRISQTELCVDPIPAHGGIINGCQKLFFDADHRPVINYHKSDENGHMQIYAARPEADGWSIQKLTDWNKPVVFGGGGSMGFIGIHISGLSEAEPGVLTMTYRHRDYGSGRLVIDEQALRPLDKVIDVAPQFPKTLNVVQSDFPGMGIQRRMDIGDSGDERVHYMLQWETLGRNFDRPRDPPLPGPSMLKLYKLAATEN